MRYLISSFQFPRQCLKTDQFSKSYIGIHSMNDKRQETEFHIKISILHKLMIYVAMLIFMAVGINTYIAVKEESRVLTEGLIHTAKHMAKNVASSTESAFWSLNWIFVEKLLQETRQCASNEVIFAKVVKPNGEVYLANDKACYGDTIDSSRRG